MWSQMLPPLVTKHYKTSWNRRIQRLWRLDAYIWSEMQLPPIVTKHYKTSCNRRIQRLWSLEAYTYSEIQPPPIITKHYKTSWNRGIQRLWRLDAYIWSEITTSNHHQALQNVVKSQNASFLSYRVVSDQKCTSNRHKHYKTSRNHRIQRLWV